MGGAPGQRRVEAVRTVSALTPPSIQAGALCSLPWRITMRGRVNGTWKPRCLAN